MWGAMARQQDKAIRRTCGGGFSRRLIIGYLKAQHRMDRNYLKGRNGDRSNAVLAAAGNNFGLLLRWLAMLLRALIRALLAMPSGAQISKNSQ